MPSKRRKHPIEKKPPEPFLRGRRITEHPSLEKKYFDVGEFFKKLPSFPKERFAALYRIIEDPDLSQPEKVSHMLAELNESLCEVRTAQERKIIARNILRLSQRLAKFEEKELEYLKRKKP